MSGEKITISAGQLKVPNNPTIPFIEGDGTGPDIWAASVRVLDAAVAKAYQGNKKIEWVEVLAGEKANNQTGSWLPEATLDAFKEYLVGIKGPLTTPVGKGIRSLNVALRQKLDLYACVRPVRWFKGVPSPVKRPDLTDIVVFRENTEDIYAGIEYQAGTEDNKKFLDLFKENFAADYAKIRFAGNDKITDWKQKAEAAKQASIYDQEACGIGIKPVSAHGTERVVRGAIDYAIAFNKPSVTLVHKGNIMKFTEGAFRDWGYKVAAEVYGAQPLDGGPWHIIKAGKAGNAQDIIIKDVIADAFLQQILLRPAEYHVVATLNLNGDYVSDALAAIVGGIGIAPGANINYATGHAIFEATHGTAPKYANQDKVNPSSVILSGAMMFEYLGWPEARDLIFKGIEGAIAQQKVTYDFARQMENPTELKCSEFADALIENM